MNSLDTLDRWALSLAGRLIVGAGVATLALALVVGRYLTGWPLVTREVTGATWTRSGQVPPGRPWPRLGWRYWPLWQRAAVRWALVALAWSGWTWPTWTALAAVVAASGTTTAALAVRYRARRPPFGRVPLRARLVREVTDRA